MRRDVPNYLTPLFYDAYQVWTRYTRFGLPNGRGWRQEREIVIRVIEIFETEKAEWLEKQGKHGSSGRTKNNSKGGS